MVPSPPEVNHRSGRVNGKACATHLVLPDIGGHDGIFRREPADYLHDTVWGTGSSLCGICRGWLVRSSATRRSPALLLTGTT